ncbi:hypothetical protein ABFS82_09G050200 [Erythranthe guttata]|uniref:DOG1 domain-containing protein n=1 Tax=Erythranthe guttata TaxID=4155 RepID=A0A022S2F6_ERYGU|nr:PREDICTED: transcription factor TGA2-like [Erythranthe guttata]EYU45430.1 hypothetical protein MIMGU_mgv1a012463mg [Erythranthe guttata]|eukprot:XP_012842689.1 PREDICTED: transcription factor TGA2-like [Erythranthe guttata]
MSNLANGITHTAHGVGEHVSFHMFFDSWIVEQNHQLQELVSAASASASASEASVLIPLVVQHYEHYYKTKSMWAKKDILSMFRPSWRSSLEKAYMWVGGWRPTMTFHLLYSKCGLQFQDTGNLSHSQMERVDKLHKTTLWKEKMITEKLAKLQETMADSSMVELTDHSRHGGDQVVHHQGLVDAALAPKEKGLVGILQMADELRLNTLKDLILILSPIQGVYFLIAAAELHLRMHDWGKKRDDDASHNHC